MFGIKSRSNSIFVVAILIVFDIFHITGHENNEEVIYILIWTSSHFEPFNFIDMGFEGFMNCTFKNCFLTPDHDYFMNVQEFDVIIFNVVNLETNMDLPINRSENQKYFMYGVEPAAYHPIPEVFNGFFNLTFTYKLSSNVTIPCVVINNHNNEVIGPKVDMHWMKLSEMNDTSELVKNKLQNKHIAAAWIVSHCESPWRRLYAEALQKELARYGHSLDIYGLCGTKQCPKGDYGICGNIKCPRYERMDECLSIIQSDYYFYLSFENSFGEDYVTEKLLHALEHYAVPVVFGSANYSRFMLQGIYLDANVLYPKQLAAEMNEIIKNKTKYYQFFKWHGYYSYHFSGEDRFSGELCRLCTFLNNNTLMNQRSVYENITAWWNEAWPTWPTPKTVPIIPETTIGLILDEDEPNIISKLGDMIYEFLPWF